MKFVLVNNLLNHGGAERSFRRIASILSTHGHDVVLITMMQEIEAAVYLPENVKYDFVIYDSRVGSIASRIYAYIRNFLARGKHSDILLKKINSCHADVCISFKENDTYLLPVICSSAKRKICWFRHDITDYQICRNILTHELPKYKKLFSQLDCLLFVTNNSMQNFLRYFSLRKICNYIHNSIDCKSIENQANLASIERVSSKVIFVCVARIAREKGQDLLADAARILNARGFSERYVIWIVGDGNGTISEKQLKLPQIELLGYQHNPYPYIAAADVVVCPSRSEGCPNVILEAMALGKPLLGTKTSGGLELLDNGQFGMLADIDAMSIADAMETLFDHEVRNYYKHKSMARVLDFSNKSIYDKLISIV